MKLSVAEVNTALEAWPLRTQKWPIPGYKGYWMRGKPIGNGAPQPYIKAAGASVNTTEPDGLYLYVHEKNRFADLIAIEVCGGQQNFYDKRARYLPGAGADEVVIPKAWLDSSISIQKGRMEKCWRASGWFKNAPTSDIILPKRHLRVLFALPEKEYHRWGVQNGPAGHEYFCMHSHLALIQNQNVQEFLKGMALMKHFLRRPSE